MAKNIVPSSVTYTCDICNCNCGGSPALSMRGIRQPDNGGNMLNGRSSVSLDLCTDCVVEFDAWISAAKSSHNQ